MPKDGKKKRQVVTAMSRTAPSRAKSKTKKKTTTRKIKY